MKAADRLKRQFGGNVDESVAPDRRVRLDVPAAALGAGAGDVSRHAGMGRLKAFAVPLDRIAPDPDQPRKEFDPDVLARLAASLAEHGQLQPCRVRWDAGRRVYVLVAGEQRFRAAGLAGLATLDCVEAPADADPSAVLTQQLVENCLRSDLKPVEQAAAFRRLMDTEGWSARQTAARLHLSPNAVLRALDLLDLPEAVRASVDAGDLAASTAAEIGKLKDPEVVAAVAGEAVAGGLTRAEVVDAVRAVLAAKAPPRPRAAKPDPLAVNVGDAVVTVRWTRPSAVSAAACLRAALKAVQGEGRVGGAAGKNSGNDSDSA